MKKIVLFCFLFAGVNIYSQTTEPILVKPKTEYHYSKKSNLKLQSLNELITELTSDSEVMSYEITNEVNGKQNVKKGKKGDFLDQLNGTFQNSDLNSKLLLNLQFVNADGSIHSNKYAINIVE